MTYHDQVLDFAHNIEEVQRVSRMSRVLRFRLEDGTVAAGLYGGLHFYRNGAGRHSCVAEINTIPDGDLCSVDMSKVVAIELDSKGKNH